jgi:ribosomal-protein-alanine N-acetyltransferase
MNLMPLTPAHANLAALLHATGFPNSWPAEAFVALLETPSRLGALALTKDQPSGLIMLQQTPGEAEVLTLVVAPAYRRMGVATGLLNWAIESSRSTGANKLFLDVSEANEAARRLYDSLGFVEVGRRSGYYPTGGGVETALILARSVVRPEPSR